MSVRYFKDLGHLYESKVVGDQQKLEQDTSALKGTGPAEAEGVEPIEVDPKNKKRKDSVYDEESFSNNVEQSDENAVKKERAKINNFTMRQKSNKSSFDKLFEDVMGNDDPLDMGGMDVEMAPGGDEELGDEDLEGDVITIELDREVAEKLHGLLGDVLGDEGDGEDIEDIEDLGDENGFGGEEELPESHVDLQSGPSDAVSKLAGHNNKVGGDANPAGGSADTGSGGQENGGKPSPARDSVAELTGKNNKVGGKITGGNKHAFKA